MYDVVIVGGGLQGCLIVLALAAHRPEARVALVERDARLGGNHTWCFHAGDLGPADAPIVAPAIAHRWDGYVVAFPEHGRTIDSAYAAVTSESIDVAVRAAVATRRTFELLAGTTAVEVERDRVELADGRVLHASLVIDARGPERYTAAAGTHAYQKFVGLELELARPHGLTRPMLMDARVEQVDGFRFVYVLPLSPTRVLVEDTYYADGPTLDRVQIADAVRAYAADQGFEIAAVVREEHGVLPLPLEAAPAPPRFGDGPLVAGYAGGWFHPTTGYSFPIALRIAGFVVGALGEGDPAIAWAAVVAEHRKQAAFALQLNRMMFRWFTPTRRHHVLARFYRLPAETIARFYALATTRLDRMRVLFGRPPRGMSWRAALTGGRA